jgi:hypothetical protein
MRFDGTIVHIKGICLPSYVCQRHDEKRRQYKILPRNEIHPIVSVAAEIEIHILL